MKPRVRSVLLLTATLLIGMVLGGLLRSSFFDGRMKRMHSLRTEEGFVGSYLETIQPADAAQEAAVRAILSAAAAEVVGSVRANREYIGQRMETMRQSLYPLLDDEQRVRVEERAWRPKRSSEDKEKKD